MEENLIGRQSDNDARIIREWELRSHLGQVLTIIDSLGLQDKQGKAVKDLITQHIWRDLWNGGTPIIRSKKADALLMEAMEEEYKSMGTHSESK